MAGSVGTGARLTRRAFGGGVAAVGAGLLAAPAVLAQARPRVVVVGGGVAGVAVARALAASGRPVDVTLVNERPNHTTGSFSNLYLAGFRSLRSLTHSYEALRAPGLALVVDQALAIDRDAQSVRLAAGPALPYDRLAVAPGLGFRSEAIEGYDVIASETMPHAYAGGYQHHLLRNQLRALPQGGLFVLGAPAAPYRCPTAPYERAAMAARLLSRLNPRAKILVIDGKDSFPQQALFMRFWAERYGEMIEWSSASATGGGVRRVDAAARRISIGAGDTLQIDAASIIPPQRAATILATAGLVDPDGWAPVAPDSMRSILDPTIFVLGDAARYEPVPKTASVARGQARLAAAAILADLDGAVPSAPTEIDDTVWSFIDAAAAIKSGGRYLGEPARPRRLEEIVTDPAIDPRGQQDNALEANRWYAEMATQLFG